MGIDSTFITADLVHFPHDEEFVAQGFERFQDTIEALALDRFRDAEPEEDIEGPDGNLPTCRGWCSQGPRDEHFLKERQADGGGANSAKHGAAIDAVLLHGSQGWYPIIRRKGSWECRATPLLSGSGTQDRW